jgi:hypothetical protein
MITWPDDEKLTALAQKNMVRFKGTALAKELEEDTHTWKFVNWSWTKDAPHKWILEDDARREVALTMDAEGMWATKRAF